MTSRKLRGGLAGLVGSIILGVAGLNLQGCSDFNDAQALGIIGMGLGSVNDTRGANVFGTLGAAALSAGNAEASRSQINVYGNGYSPAPAPQVTRNNSGPYWSGRPEFGRMEHVCWPTDVGSGYLSFYKEGLQYISSDSDNWFSIPYSAIDESSLECYEDFTFWHYPFVRFSTWGGREYKINFRKSEKTQNALRTAEIIRSQVN